MCRSSKDSPKLFRHSSVSQICMIYSGSQLPNWPHNHPCLLVLMPWCGPYHSQSGLVCVTNRTPLKWQRVFQGFILKGLALCSAVSWVSSSWGSKPPWCGDSNAACWRDPLRDQLREAEREPQLASRGSEALRTPSPAFWWPQPQWTSASNYMGDPEPECSSPIPDSEIVRHNKWFLLF